MAVTKIKYLTVGEGTYQFDPFPAYSSSNYGYLYVNSSGTFSWQFPTTGYKAGDDPSFGSTATNYLWVKYGAGFGGPNAYTPVITMYDSGDVGVVIDNGNETEGSYPIIITGDVYVQGNFTMKDFYMSDDVGAVIDNPLTITGADAAHTITLNPVSGQVSAYSFNAMSDRRLKENIEETNIDFNNILENLNIVDFNFKDDKDKKVNIGLIAQELQEALPEKYRDAIVAPRTAANSTESYLTINESKLVYIALLALKDQKKQIAILNSRIKALERK